MVEAFAESRISITAPNSSQFQMGLDGRYQTVLHDVVK